jgi:tetratricopeptide (TPR) repeat protein
MMVSYDEPTSAVQSAIAMQRALRDHNREREVAEQIHIRIGINGGPGLVETQDVFGDVVHVAARVEACALPDQILISSTTYERLPPSIPCRFLGAMEVKGKATPIELYEVSWDERRTFQETVLLRGPGVIARPTKIVVLEVCREGERLKLSAHERWPGEERPVRHYEYVDVSFGTIQQDVDTIGALLQRITNRRGTLATATWEDIKAQGAALYSQLLTPAIQARLRASTATELFLYIDDALVQIPWELLFDGQDFLCRRFSMGCLVSTQQALDEGAPERAKALFQQQVEDPEPRTRSQAYAGLAAVAFAGGDDQRAPDFATQAETADADMGYSHVIRGHILLNQGKTAEALAAYRTTTTKPHTLPWQQAIAYDRLGRLYAAQGDTTKALEHYDKAMTQHRDLAAVHANKAHLLDQLGKHQEALDLYRQAL